MVDDIYDEHAARKMGIDRKGQVVMMVHCGSRGLGHQVATGEPISSRKLACYFSDPTFLADALVAMEKAMKRDKIDVNDRQLACARLNSPEGQDYLKAMAAAANFAWVNRSCMTFCARQVCTAPTDIKEPFLIRNVLGIRQSVQYDAG